MRRTLFFCNLLLALMLQCVLSYKTQGQSADLRRMIENGREAYEKGDFATSLSYFEQANITRPDHPMITKLLIRLHSLNNKKEKAYKGLKDLMLIDADLEFLLHDDLQFIQGDEQFKEVQQAYDVMNKAEGIYDTVAVISHRQLHPESIVTLPDDEGILLGSVHEKRIVMIDNEGEMQEWVPAGAHGLYAVMGMTMDEERGLLWVASTAIPQMVWYSEELEGKATVFAFDIGSRALIKKFEPDVSGKYWFGDLTIDDTGSVYISNSQAPEIYRIASIEGSLEKWRSFPELFSLQGLTVIGERLFFADYLKGIYSVELDGQSASLRKVQAPKETILKGIDGMYGLSNGLITIQNGVYPNRISFWTLSDDQSELIDMTYIDKANLLFGEPTLGNVNGGSFYYIANSQWNGYHADGRILENDLLKDIYVLKARLPN